MWVFFRDKRRKRIVGEFAKMFEKVAGVKVLVGIEVRNRGRVGYLSTDFCSL